LGTLRATYANRRVKEILVTLKLLST